MHYLSIGLRGTVAALALVALAGTAHAQQTEAEAVGDPREADQEGVFEDDEIIVTAQRREERVQDIPVAISAFGSEQLERTGVVSIENIAPRVPSFYFGSFGALRPQLYIRGIGTRSFDPGSESSVGVFVDEVYLGRSSGTFGSLKDIERIEVLRGPQGTLYGRNTIGGAINVITKAPTSTFEAQAEVGIGNRDGYEAFGAVGGPITSDASLMFRVAGWHTERDGYIINLTTGTQFQGVENTGARARLTFEPTERFQIDLTAEYIHDGDKGAFGGINQGTGRSITGAPPNPRVIFFAHPTRLAGAIPPESLRRAALSSDPTLDRDAYSYIGRVEYDADFATLTSISAYKKLTARDARDLEGSSLRVIDQISVERSKQFTQEIRLTSNPDGAMSLGGALDWIVGGFYYTDSSDRRDDFFLGIDSAVRAVAGTPTTDSVLADFKIDSYAVFAQATLHLGEKFDVTLGGRYTEDEKSVRFQGLTTDALPLIAVPFMVERDAKYTSFDPRIVATYKFTPDVNVYASYSTGFKSGGFQFAPFNAASANIVFDPEDIKTYEVGFKSEWLDRMLRINGAAFYYDYKNLQVSRIIDTASGPQTLITNAASSTVKGVDLEMLLRPTSNIDFSIAYGYLDAKYDDYDFNIGQNLEFDGTTLVRAPKHSINVGAEWRIPTSDDSGLALRADYSLLSTFFHEPGEGDPRFGSGIPLTREEGYGLLDLRASYEFSNFRVSTYMTNVFDVEYRRTVNALGATIVGFAGQPRTYGLKLAYSY